jgi:HK97 family phage portal protein
MPVSRQPRNVVGGVTVTQTPYLNSDGQLILTESPIVGSPYTPVTDATMLALPAAWRCLQIICNGIGMLNVYAVNESDPTEARVDPVPAVCADPWPLVSPMNWKVQVVASMLMHGNAYCVQADPDPANGYPRQLPVISPHDVRTEVVDGMPIHWVGEQGPFGPLDILHFRGFTLPGEAVGIGIMEAHRRGLGFAMDLDAYGATTYAQGAVPPVVLHINRPELSREQAADIQSRWMLAHGYGQRTPAVVPNSIQVETIAFSPEDAEYIASRIQSAIEVCWIFGVDPRVLALQAGQGALTYANLEMAQSDLARDSYQPWTTRIEQTLSRVLPRHVDARFDFAAMLRPTMVDRFEAYKTGLEAGFLTVDEVRALEDLPPIEQEDKATGKLDRPLRTVSDNEAPVEGITA